MLSPINSPQFIAVPPSRFTIGFAQFLTVGIVSLCFWVLVGCGGGSGGDNSISPGSNNGNNGGDGSMDARLLGSWLPVEGEPSAKVMFTFATGGEFVQHRAPQAIQDDRDDGDVNPMVAALGGWSTTAAGVELAPAEGVISTTLNGQEFENGSTTSFPSQPGIALRYYFDDDGALWIDSTGMGILYVEMYEVTDGPPAGIAFNNR